MKQAILRTKSTDILTLSVSGIFQYPLKKIILRNELSVANLVNQGVYPLVITNKSPYASLR